MRCWALAEELASRGAKVRWQGTLAVPWLQAAFKEVQWRFEAPQPPNQMEAELVVVDSYTLPHAYRQSLVDRGLAVLPVVDDYHRELGPGTLWVNPGAPAKLATGTYFLNGPDYVLIRQEIRELRRLRQEVGASDDITFMLGGTDFAKLGGAVDSLDLPWPVFAGPGSGSSPKITWMDGGNRLLRRAATSRVVVSAAGVSSWEMLHIGVPLVLIQAAENQRGNYEWMTSQGWALGLGHKLEDIQELAEALSIEATSESRIDGLGAQRVVDVALTLL